MIVGGIALDNAAMVFGGHVEAPFSRGFGGRHRRRREHLQRPLPDRDHRKRGPCGPPGRTVDAVVVGSLMVMALQTIVSREVNPAHPSVVTIGRFDAGTAGNVIAGQATLEGSIRSQDEDVRMALHRSIERMAKSIGQLHGAGVEVAIHHGTPPLINPRETTELARHSAAVAVGEDQVVGHHGRWWRGTGSRILVPNQV